MKTKTFFKKEQDYVAPEVKEFTIFSEGCLCVSEGDDEGADAGYFGENVW